MSYRAGFHDLQRPETHLIDEVRASMSGLPRALPSEMALDAVGHALYARVTTLPAFALARAELDLIATHRRALFAAADGPKEIVDLRAGTATQPRALLGDVQRYVAIEPCRAVLDDAVEGLAAAFPHLEVRGIVGDATFGFAWAPPGLGHRLIVMLDATFGRLDATTARLKLAQIRGRMEPDDRLLIGVDLAKEDSRIADAYSDSNDVFGAYFRNAMRRTNREVGTDFRSSDWELVVEGQPDRGRVEVRFAARRALRVEGGKTGARWDFATGEPLVVEHAYKPSEGQVAAVALGAGFGVSHVWKDGEEGYALFMLVP